MAVGASDSRERRRGTYPNSEAAGQEFLAFHCADGRVGRAEKGVPVRYVRSILFTGAALCANPAFAADALKFGPPPAWVRAQPIPAAKATQAPLAVLLNDQQTMLERGKIIAFSEGVIQIRNEQGLAAGNLAVVWQPATDTVTINKLQIRRGDKVIDVLAGGQTFTILRRETNLDAATLDGTLTGTLQPEGLQVGDIIDLATTVERSDPVMKGHVENMFAAWDGVPIQDAHASLRWPVDLHVQVRQTPNLPVAQRSSSNGMNLLEIAANDVQPLIAPKGAPQRFRIGRLAEATDFAAWSDLANLFIPLYREASAVPASGPLHDEVERIRAASTNAKTRAEQALALVQDRIRYVALVMGQGGYVPAPAETTWSRRFGDCKAKTALLLGILHSLGVQAEPVVVQARLGDMIADRSPMVALFNHVLVRAHIGGKDYWLDGTRTGDTDLDSIEVPNFGWGLPLVANAQLVRMVPKPLDAPNLERHVAIDASAGIYTPATITIEEVSRGDSAVELNAGYSGLTAEQRDQQLHDEAKTFFDGFTNSSSSVQFDKAKREFRMTIKGTAKLSWKDGWFYVPTSVIAFNPDFDRAAGPLHDVPLAITHPTFVKDEAIIRLPHGFAAQQKLQAPVRETLAGVEYARSETVSGDTLTVDSSERSVVPEVPYKDALAAEARLRTLYNDDVYLSSTVVYAPTAQDVAALPQSSPGSADEYVDRGNLFLNAAKYDEAIADFTQALTLDSKNLAALADRGLSHVWKRQFDLAETDLAAAERLDPRNATVLRARGLLAESKGDCEAAVDEYTKSLQVESSSSFALGHRAECEASISRSDEALADTAEALKRDPSWSALRSLRATIFAERNNQAAAAREIAAIESEKPDSVSTWIEAGRLYGRLRMAKEAMAAFDRALAIKPRSDTYLNRAWARPMNDYAARIADIDQALKLDPNNVNALAEKAEQLAATGELRKAADLYGQVVKLAPARPDFALSRAIILYKAGDHASAMPIIDERRRSTKTSTDLNNLCWQKAIRGVLLDSALQDCNDALKLSPGDSAVLDSLAFVKLRTGKLDEAIALYTQAIAKNKLQSASYMGRAMTFALKGDMIRAQTDRAEAIKLDPDAETRFAEYGLKFSDAAQTAKTSARTTAK